MSNDLSCFKAYDIRGRIPGELNDDISYRIGRAYAEMLRPRSVVVGRDIRLSGPALYAALIRGLTEAGANVLDIGVCGTEQVYFATPHFGADGGIMVTASHNPADYNGMKLVREDSRPLSGDTGLFEIRDRVQALSGNYVPADACGSVCAVDGMTPYAARLVEYAKGSVARRLTLVANSGNGCAGPVIDILEKHLLHRFIKVQHEPDGNFPNGVPNPLLVRNRSVTHDAVLAAGADMGIAWDGDFDRCFLFDETGEFIEGYYIVGLLAKALLATVPGSRIIHDPRLTWNTQEIVQEAGGVAIQSKTGHAFIKERMRLEDALYGGEMSAHHYFRDFAYCDSGMIPWLLVASLIVQSGMPLSQLVRERMERYPVSGEINRHVCDASDVLARIRDIYGPTAIAVDETDGLGFEYADWRFNLRSSNTEPVMRLNVESRGDRKLMERRTAELLALIGGDSET